MFKRVSEIIEIIQAYHCGLGNYYLTLKDEIEDERSKLLLDFLSKSEFFIDEYLEKYKEGSPRKILNCWVKYVPWLPTNVYCKCREELKINSPLQTYDILEIANHFDNCLIDFYTTMVNEIQNREAQEMFSNLLRVAKKHEMNLSRDVSWLYDL